MSNLIIYGYYNKKPGIIKDKKPGRMYMCTAITYQTKDFYFGRTLDYDCSYGEEIVITPHNFTFIFRNRNCLKKNYAIIGMAHVAEGCPLYYDAINERGLGMAGLNFTGNADYKEAVYGKDNIASLNLYHGF